jgi:hypothetical protein
MLVTLLEQRGMTKYWRPVSCEKFLGQPVPRSCSAKLGDDETAAHSPCFSRHAARGTSFVCFSFSARLTRQLFCDITFRTPRATPILNDRFSDLNTNTGARCSVLALNAFWWRASILVKRAETAGRGVRGACCKRRYFVRFPLTDPTFKLRIPAQQPAILSSLSVSG